MQPLADKLRPKNIYDMVGQSHIIGKGKIINKLLTTDLLTKMKEVMKMRSLFF